jgi:hypothetical protein
MNTAMVLAGAVTLASAMPALLFALVLPLLDKYLTPGNLLFYFLCAVAVSAIHILVLGLPVVFTLQRAGRLSLPTISASGLAIGAFPTAAIFFVQWASDSSHLSVGALFTILFAGVLGAVGAMSFYMASHKVLSQKRTT